MPAKRKQLNFKDTDLWYFVGLIATDGCLSLDGQHIEITAKEKAFLESIKKRLGLANKIGIKKNSRGSVQHRIQLGNKNFYEFLLSVGLTPRKSLTLGELKVPSEHFHDFFRGVIDGDGSIRRWIHPTNQTEQWSLRIYSGLRYFLNGLGNVWRGIF